MKKLDNICSYFLIFLHAVRIFWKTPPLAVKVLVVILFILSILQPYVYTLYPFPFDYSVWVFLGNMGTSMAFLYLFVFLFAYVTVKPVIKDSRTRNARIIWLIFGCSWVLTIIPGLIFESNPWFENYELLQIKMILEQLGLILISIKYPESFLISKLQVTRAINLYKKVLSLDNEKEIQDFGMNSLVEYINKISSGKSVI